MLGARALQPQASRTRKWWIDGSSLIPFEGSLDCPGPDMSCHRSNRLASRSGISCEQWSVATSSLIPSLSELMASSIFMFILTPLSVLQGCCFSTAQPASRPASSNSSHSNPLTTAGRNRNRPHTPPSPNPGTAVQVPANTHVHNPRTARTRPNAPLRAPKTWRSTSKVWTQPHLKREREIFWDTRVSGRQEVWAAVKLAVEMAGGVGDATGVGSTRTDGSRDSTQRKADLQGAQAVLDAAGVTCPTGRLGDGVWDEHGQLYKLPRWVLSDPVNVVEGGDHEDEDEDVDALAAEEGEDDDEEGKEEYLSDTEEKEKVEKGKGRVLKADAEDSLKIKARLSDRGTDVIVLVNKSANVKTLIKSVKEEAEVSLSLLLFTPV